MSGSATAIVGVAAPGRVDDVAGGPGASTGREVIRLLQSLAFRQQLVVGVDGAAHLLNTSRDKVRELVAAGLLATVPNLSSSAKLSISVTELQRFANVGGAA